MKRVYRAPGKLMLLGEYAVLGGGEALVAAVERYAECHVTPADRPILETPGVFAEALLAKYPVPGRYRLDSGALGTDTDAGWTKFGLGSSAATTVALTRALHPEASLDEVFEIAHGIHREVQGTGSGADVAACTYGGLLRYRREPLLVEPLPRFGPLLVVWSELPADTRTLVASVARFAQAEPLAHQRIMKRLDAAAQRGIGAVFSADREALAGAAADGANAMLELDGQVDATLFPRRILELQAIAGDFCVVVKPTGAGGGDLAWCVGVDEADERALAKTLTDEGWPVMWLDIASV